MGLSQSLERRPKWNKTWPSCKKRRAFCLIVFELGHRLFLSLEQPAGLGTWARVPALQIWDFPGGSAGKESACNAGDPGSIPELGRSTGEGIGYLLQYSWASLVTQLEKNPPAMQETWVGKIPWRKEQLCTPVLWPGEFRGLYSPRGHKESDTTEQLSLSFSFSASIIARVNSLQ